MRKKALWTALQYISVPIITISLIMVWDDEFLGIIFISLFCWLFIPAIIIAAISFILSLKCRTKHQRIILAGHVVNILLLVLYLTTKAPERRCDAYIMENHYEKNKARMESFYHKIYNDIKPGCGINVEFEKGDISILHIIQSDKDIWDYRWDPNRKEVDSLLHSIGLDRKELRYIRRQLSDMGCISLHMVARPDRPYTLGFRRIGFGKYSYRIYRNPVSADELEQIKEDCMFVPYSSTVFFEFGGGAVGPQCFPNKQQYLEERFN